MSGYYRRSRPEPDNQIWIWIACVAVLLIVIGLVVNAVGAAYEKQLKADIEALEVMRMTTIGNLEKARETYQIQSAKFALHWSEGLPAQFEESQANLMDGGPVANALKAAWELVEKDQGGARSKLDEASLLVKKAEELVTRILGPPGFYDELFRKTSEAQSWLNQVDGNVAGAKVSFDALKADDWNVTHGVVFGRSYRRLADALNQMSVARQTLATRLANDNVEFDLPLAYDQATAAQAIVDEATGWANFDHTKSREADAAIIAADSSIANAQATVWFASYNQSGAQATLNTAVATLVAARNAFAGGSGIDPDYQQAYDLAVLAQSQANQAVSQTVPPTDTPVPPPTTVYVDSSSDNSSGGGDTDWWSDSTSDDSGGSSDDGWSSDNGGSSDDWGSDDSWDSSSDDWGSDDGWSDSSDDWGSDDGW